MRCYLKTRAYPSLGDGTCPDPKCSPRSSSIPCLLVSSAAPGVLATPHLLSQSERGAPKARRPPRGWPALSEPSSHREPLKQNEISDAKTSHTPARASRPTAAASAAEPIAVYHLYNLLDVSSSEEPS